MRGLVTWRLFIGQKLRKNFTPTPALYPSSKNTDSALYPSSKNTNSALYPSFKISDSGELHKFSLLVGVEGVQDDPQHGRQ